MIGLIESSGEASKERGYLVELVENIFKDGGYLQNYMALEHRPEQEAMARSVAASLEFDQPLLFEAGTGVGKSLAYLIPGILHSIENKRPFIISSHTISLQEQIQDNDLKICKKLFNQVPQLRHYSGFKTALMIGKSNYCCSTRLSNALTDAQSEKQSEFLRNEIRADLYRIAKWASMTKKGVIQEISPLPTVELWEAINADSSTCSRKNCDPSQCFYQKARRDLLSADCVIVNHSLLFSLINAGTQSESNARGILLADDFVVLDEAHHIPSVASDHFGTNVSSYGIERALKRIYNPLSKRGILKKYGQTGDLEAVTTAIKVAREFFKYLEIKYLIGKSIQRIYEPDFCENILSGPLNKVADRIATLIGKINEERIKDELHDHRLRILAYRDAISNFISFAEEDHVQWLEKVGRKANNVGLRTAPIHVGSYLRKYIFQRQTTAVLTSATLSNGNHMQVFQEKVGAESIETEVVFSPFDYKNNCRIYIASDAPHPESSQGRIDLDYLTNMITWSASRIDGGTLVLFTSHLDLRIVGERVENFFNELKRPLFVQSDKISRTEITRKFAEAGNGVLFGTDSFWTGVDIPGPALSQVIIARLPFVNPRHPMSEARNEYIRSIGGNPFNEITIPDALIKFRQGIGRLIRRREDSGNIVILDSRILNKAYGTNFLNVLPNKHYFNFNLKNRDLVFA